MTLNQFRNDEPDLWAAAQEWIGDGWGVCHDVEISALMVAAALEKEALTQDHCVTKGDSDPSFPKRLRQLAIQLALGSVNEMERLP
jgi:hypothetical protein